MQVANAAPRDESTVAEITALLNAESIEISAGLELLDSDDAFIEDISAGLVSGQIDRGNYRTIHGTCNLRIAKDLQWGSQRVRPYLTLSNLTTVGGNWGDGVWGDGYWAGTSGTEARFNLGVYLLSTPDRAAGVTPATYDVAGYDKLQVLALPHGSTYSADAGDAYLTLIEALISDAGESKVLLDQSAIATTLPTGRVWSTSDQGQEPTTLHIINDLLASVGYRALWVDWDGFYRSEPYQSPADRGSEWTYSADSDTTTVGQDRVPSADYFDTPNRWRFVIDDPEASSFPSEDDGLYTVINQSDGPTSIDERGRVINAPVQRLSAADQASLVSQGDRIVENDKRLDRRLTMNVASNPLHFHFDVLTITDAQLGLNGAKYVVTDWSLPLGPSDMKLELKAV